MSFHNKKWICFVAAFCWGIISMIRIFQKTSANVILLSFAAATIFLIMGIFYLIKSRK